MDIVFQAMPCQEASGLRLVAAVQKNVVRQRCALHRSIETFGATTVAPNEDCLLPVGHFLDVIQTRLISAVD